MVRNLVLLRLMSVAVQSDFRTYIRRYISPNENFEYSYLHSNALLQFRLKLDICKPHSATRYPMKCDIIDDVKLFPTVYRRIYSISQDILSQIFDGIQSEVALQKQVH